MEAAATVIGRIVTTSHKDVIEELKKTAYGFEYDQVPCHTRVLPRRFNALPPMTLEAPYVPPQRRG
eukprot:9149467-Pyramimonas_sp.AAC.1